MYDKELFIANFMKEFYKLTNDVTVGPMTIAESYLRTDSPIPPLDDRVHELLGNEAPRELPNNRAIILSLAEKAVNGDRNVDYGDPVQDFRRTGTMWSSYLGVPIKPHDVAAMMAMLKLSRIRWSPTKQDHWLDLAGYAACGYDAAMRENDAPI